jgi:3-methyladenine DNA glycosylase/8-oxoguanine DNA glycosylase
MNKSTDRIKSWGEGISYLCQVDPFLRKWIKSQEDIEVIKLRNSTSLHEFLIRSILSQQLNVAAGNTIAKRFLDLFPKRRMSISELIEMKPEKIQSAGISRNKVFSIKDLANKIWNKEIPSKRKLGGLSDREIIDHLTRVKGIGRWTAEICLISFFGRMDVLPAEDLIIRKGFASVMNLKEIPPPKMVREHAVRWQPYRTVAAKILWKAG